MNPDIEQLKRRVAELERWKTEKERQQIKYPLDRGSKVILHRWAPTRTGIFVIPVGLGNSPFHTKEAIIDGKTRLLYAAGAYRQRLL